MREMKISGVDWCHTIPDNWSIIPSKYLFRVSNVRRLDGDIQLTASQKYGIISQVDYMEREQAAIVLANKGLESWKHVEPLDFIISLRSFQGGLEMSEVKGCITWHYVVLKATQAIHHAYYKWLFKSAQYITALQRTCNFIRDGQDLRYSNFAKVPLPYPPVEEQKTIANFLDNKCAEIDALMEDIRVEISTLEEYKKSVITEAVTKGLNPNVEMKDSGIAWVGECPGHWEQHPVYYYFSERKAPNALLAETNLLSLSYGKIKRKDINTNGGLLPASFNAYNIIEAGDIIIRPTDLQNDKRSLRTALSTEHGIITSAYIALRPKLGVNSAYFHYLLHAYDVQKVFYNMGNGVRQGLNYSEFSKLMLLAPPAEEQQAIVSFLDAKSDEIESTIAEKREQQIALAEYKKSLIYEYVTGKKEVPTL